MAGDWTSLDAITSDRVKKAITWGDKLKDIVTGATDESWDDLVPMIDEERFVRRGNERDQESGWPAYRAMLEHWKQGSGGYDKTLYRATEAGDVVLLDFDEHVVATDGSVTTLRSISIYAFDPADRIVSIDVCMGFHQPR